STRPSANASTPCQRPIEWTSPRIPIELLHESNLASCQPWPGWFAIRIQPTHTSNRRNASAKVPGDIRSLSPFVHVPTWFASAISSPAPATTAMESQKRPVVCIPIWVAPQSPRPASAAASASVSPRDASYMPYLRILFTSFRCPLRVERSSRFSGFAELLESEPARVERGRPQLGAELVERRERVLGEHVFHHSYLAVVVERHVDVRVRDEVE